MISETIEMLGRKGADKVTGFAGVVECVSFDLYGCIQVTLKPAVNDKGEMCDAKWFDVHRVDLEQSQPVMPVPDFRAMARVDTQPETYQHGPAEKPSR